MNNEIEKAVDITQRAQRNYDLNKQIPSRDLDTLIYAAANSPSKQNETHYELHVFTDQHIIRDIYNQTKLYLLMTDKDNPEDLYGEIDGEFWQSDERSVHNSQILSNVLFVYVEKAGEPRGGTHKFAQNNTSSKESLSIYNEQISYSIGISSGQLALSAALLGYKTGFCSAFNTVKVPQIIGTTKKAKLLVGVGYDAGVNRRLHAETKNKDIPIGFQTGKPEEKWIFPTFDRHVDIYINGERSSNE